MSQKKNHASFMIGWARVQISARRPAILTDSFVDSFSPPLQICHDHCASALFLVLYSVCSYSSKQLSPELLKAFLPGNVECLELQLPFLVPERTQFLSFFMRLAVSPVQLPA